MQSLKEKRDSNKNDSFENWFPLFFAACFPLDEKRKRRSRYRFLIERDIDSSSDTLTLLSIVCLQSLRNMMTTNTTDACETRDPCQHGGICISTDSGPICECRSGDYEGAYCEKGELFYMQKHRCYAPDRQLRSWSSSSEAFVPIRNTIDFW